MFWKLFDDVNFVTRCRRYDIGLWQCPNFLFLVMGVVAAAAMTATYLISNRFYDESVTIVGVSTVTVLIFAVGHFVVRGVEQLAVANAIKTEFISILTHQLGSPLSAIKWNLEVLEGEIKENRGLPDKDWIFLGNIKESNEKMLKLVSYLTEVVRIDQGSTIFENEKINLVEVVRETIGNLEKTAAERKIKVDFKAEEKTVPVMADSKKMKVVFDNLIGNAIKYSNEGGKTEVSIRLKDGRVITTISDQGVGIPRYQRSQIFEKFFRVKNAYKYRTEGIGIGLYLVKSIVGHFGGEVWFDSLEGKGSKFYVSLPIAK